MGMASVFWVSEKGVACKVMERFFNRGITSSFLHVTSVVLDTGALPRSAALYLVTLKFELAIIACGLKANLSIYLIIWDPL